MKCEYCGGCVEQKTEEIFKCELCEFEFDRDDLNGN